jgi:hypothetical protein
MNQILRVFCLLTSLAFPCYIAPSATFRETPGGVLLSVPHY